jgi:hypothetical protein
MTVNVFTISRTSSRYTKRSRLDASPSFFSTVHAAPTGMQWVEPLKKFVATRPCPGPPPR